MINKVKINGVSINLDVVSKMKPQEIKDMGIFANDAAYDTLNSQIEAFKAKPVEPAAVEVTIPGKKKK